MPHLKGTGRLAHQSSNWGGARPNSGPKTGIVRQVTQDCIDKAASGGLHPFDLLLQVVRDEKLQLEQRVAAAQGALPYCVQRLSQKEVIIRSELDDLSAEELIARLDRMTVEIRDVRPDLKVPVLIEGEVSHVG